MAKIEISDDFGYVILTGVASIILTIYLSFSVVSARKKYNVKYPILYATNEEAEKDKNKFIFNCYQRAHQNTLETYPQFLFFNFRNNTIVLYHYYYLGRVAYAKGYQTGDPVKRGRGRFGTIGLLGLLVTCILTGSEDDDYIDIEKLTPPSLNDTDDGWYWNIQKTRLINFPL
ncbi:16562_t:CDS:2 [Entrophospora sp. SA101]|nr:16562_t:CDS:2 [Entrophospora sp. SA101]